MKDPRWKQMMDFLVGLGTDEVPHSGNNFLAHLIAVHRLIEDEFFFPAGVIGQHQSGGGSEAGIEQRRDQAVDLPVPRTGRIIQGVGDQAHQHLVSPPSAQWVMWWASHQAWGRSHPGNRQ